MSKSLNADPAPNIDTLVATLLYLMSRYQRSADDRVHSAIIDHLGMLELHPEADSPALRHLGARLKQFWESQLPVGDADQAPGATKPRRHSPPTSLH